MKTKTKTKPIVLIVEDEESLRTILDESFNREGFEVLTAKDGEAGVEIAIARQPHVVVLDLILPKMSGQDVLRSIRANDKSKNIPVIVATNVGNNQAIYECIAEGAQDIFIKSEISVAHLVGHVKKRLDPAFL